MSESGHHMKTEYIAEEVMCCDQRSSGRSFLIPPCEWWGSEYYETEGGPGPSEWQK